MMSHMPPKTDTPSPETAGPPPQPSWRWRSSYYAVVVVLVLVVSAVMGVRALLHDTAPRNAPQRSGSAIATNASAMCNGGTHLHSPAYQQGTQPPLALFARS